MKTYSFIIALTYFFDCGRRHVDGSSSLLGRSKLTESDIRALMEVYNTYNRGFALYCRFHGWYDEYVQPPKVGKDIFRETFISKYLQRSFSTKHYARILVKDSNYLRFIDKQKEESAHCAEVSYFLSCIGANYIHSFEAVDHILEMKYPRIYGNFEDMRNRMATVRKFVHEKIILNYDEERKKMPGLQKIHWDITGMHIEEDVKIMNRYFRIMLFGEKRLPSEEPVDLKADINLWTMAISIKRQLYRTKSLSFNRRGTQRKKKLSSFLIRILRQIDIFKARIDQDDDDVKRGFSSGFLTMRPDFGSDAELSLGLHFQRRNAEDLWKNKD